MRKVSRTAWFLCSRFGFSLRACLLLAVGVGLALSGPSARAAVDTWSSSATSLTWNTGTNWSGTDLPPAPGDSLVFATSGAGGVNLNNNLTSSSFNIAGITFNNGASAFVISGSAFALTGGITNNGTNLEIINDPFSMTAVQTFTTNAGGGNLSLGGSISGVGGIIAAGTGILTLSPSNTYTGTTTVNGGTLSVSSIITSGSSSLGNASSPVTLNGGDLSYTGNSATYARGFTIGASGGEFDVTTSGQTVTISSTLSLANGNMTFGGSGSTSLSGTLSGGNTLTKNGVGTLTLTASVAATATMPIVVNAGTFYQNITANLTNPLGSGQITIAPGATLQLGLGGDTNSYVNPLSVGNSAGTATIFNSSGHITFSNNVTFPSSSKRAHIARQQQQ